MIVRLLVEAGRFGCRAPARNNLPRLRNWRSGTHQGRGYLSLARSGLLICRLQLEVNLNALDPFNFRASKCRDTLHPVIACDCPSAGLAVPGRLFPMVLATNILN